jgi:hypothetical protein
MAKKAVASLQTGSKRLSKAINMVRSSKTGAYTFVEAIILNKWMTFSIKSKFHFTIYLKLLSNRK